MGGLAGLGRRGALALGAATLLAACTPTTKSTDENTVRTDSEPLERRFTELGSLSDAHWLGFALGGDSRVSAPGPTDVRVVGFARLTAGGVAAIVGGRQRGFQRETPSKPPETLAQFTPKSARWVRSESFDREVTGGTYSGAFYFDPSGDWVYFDTINPEVVSSSGP
ncbi:hypothetical protein GCM10017771_25030 [Streptomyces capitiformicae]|uniref:Uncharacterized protein n=2 Tax=Streptomyces capitiformicae TaxID=2014920 RepID=A0A919L7Z6_9ACTN|nr:hypothetical protein [Streptomyces capitiformicae]GHH86739.1 hypothetical protein GCM10017771_25030 [Streptomyces capitiformicae]